MTEHFLSATMLMGLNLQFSALVFQYVTLPPEALLGGCYNNCAVLESMHSAILPQADPS